MAENRLTEPHGLFQSDPGKQFPAFREEDQEMAQELNPVVVGPPSYASPDPATLGGRLVSVEEHPLSADISEDYGADHAAAVSEFPVGDRDVVLSTMTPEDQLQADAVEKAGALDDNERDSWSKADWQTKARAAGLSEKGSKAELQARVEEHEENVSAAKEMNAEDWKSEIDGADNADDLAELRALYGASGADYSTVAAAFDAKQAEFDGSQNDDQ